MKRLKIRDPEELRAKANDAAALLDASPTPAA